MYHLHEESVGRGFKLLVVTGHECNGGYIGCIGMSSTEYARFVTNEKLVWTPSYRVDCVKDNDSPSINKLVAQMADITGKIGQLIYKIDCLKTEEITLIQNDIKELETQMSSFEPRLKALDRGLERINAFDHGYDPECVIGELNDRSQCATQ